MMSHDEECPADVYRDDFSLINITDVQWAPQACLLHKMCMESSTKEQCRGTGGWLSAKKPQGNNIWTDTQIQAQERAFTVWMSTILRIRIWIGINIQATRANKIRWLHWKVGPRCTSPEEAVDFAKQDRTDDIRKQRSRIKISQWSPSTPQSGLRPSLAQDPSLLTADSQPVGTKWGLVCDSWNLVFGVYMESRYSFWLLGRESAVRGRRY